MTVTVAICTWNRADLLDRTLTGMRALRIPAGVEWELLVVDNNSTDETPAVLARHAAGGKLPLRTLVERKQGHSNARNCAVASARGELIIWTDDDVLVEPDWLAGYADARRRWPAAAFFGGPIRPWWERPPNGWQSHLCRSAGHLWAVLDLGDECRPFTTDEHPFGANMAIVADVQRRYEFDQTRGHVAGRLAGGDESALFDRLRADGYAGYWLPAAEVRHYIPADRMTRQYVRRRGYEYGWASYNPAQAGEVRQVFGVPRFALRQYGGYVVRQWILWALRSDRQGLAAYQSARLWGVIRRASEMARSSPVMRSM